MSEAQWYPGKMARASARLARDLKVIDLVVELLDARVPFASGNPMFDEIIGGRKRLTLLHKADRADDAVTARWLTYFRKNGKEALSFSVYRKESKKKLLNYFKTQQDTLLRGRLKRSLRIIFVGIPNVGKSTLLNFFARRAAARTGNQPGITRGHQWIRIAPGMDLLDTPGILSPKISGESSWLLAAVGAVPAGKFDLQDCSLKLLEFYLNRGRADLLAGRYGHLQPGSPAEVLEQVGILQGCLQAEGRPDIGRAAALVLRDFQDGKLGRVSLEEPPV